ncbi:hypothetical protein [Rhizobium binae]|nr:hypothetical protein [Rhizobium binae]
MAFIAYRHTNIAIGILFRKAGGASGEESKRLPRRGEAAHRAQA